MRYLLGAPLPVFRTFAGSAQILGQNQAIVGSGFGTANAFYAFLLQVAGRQREALFHLKDRLENVMRLRGLSGAGRHVDGLRHGEGQALLVGLGLRHGAYCVGCCWALMALLFVGGVMILVWIAALTLVHPE